MLISWVFVYLALFPSQKYWLRGKLKKKIQARLMKLSMSIKVTIGKMQVISFSKGKNCGCLFERNKWKLKSSSCHNFEVIKLGQQNLQRSCSYSNNCFVREKALVKPINLYLYCTLFCRVFEDAANNLNMRALSGFLSSLCEARYVLLCIYNYIQGMLWENGA